MTEKLKPCPWCGSTASVHTCCSGYPLLNTTYYIECDECGADKNTLAGSVEDAISDWNTRVKPKCLNCECVDCSEFCNVCGRDD